METVSGLPPATGGHPLTWGLKVDRTNTPAIGFHDCSVLSVL
jgi:hypothetical protein